MRESFARTKWTVDDVLIMQPDWTKKRAAEFLEGIEDDIEEAMVQEGWAVLYHELNINMQA